MMASLSLVRPFFVRRSFSSNTSIGWKIDPRRRTNLIFGANTDVGKTIISAGLVRASLDCVSKQLRHRDSTPTSSTVHYIKPLQCGGSDQEFVELHARPHHHRNSDGKLLISETLFSWETPASPHSASRIEGKPVSDEQVLNALYQSIIGRQLQNESMAATTTFIETAGGVLSPSSASPDNASPRHAIISTGSDNKSNTTTNDEHNNNGKIAPWGWITQADLYQPLQGLAPVVLVGDGRLGGISATLAALESLILRGYDIAAVVFLETHAGNYDNASALRDYVRRRLRSGSGEALFSVPSQSIVSLPPIPADPSEPLFEWYNETSKDFSRLNANLQNMWEGQVADLQALHKGEGQHVLWWPETPYYENMTHDDDGYVSKGADEKDSVTFIDSASGDRLQVLVDDKDKNDENRAPRLECVSLLDTRLPGIGRGDSALTLASAAATSRYGHVPFPKVVHAPAVTLGQRLIGPTGPGNGWADRVFFTDCRSNAMEVAIRMGIKLYQIRKKVSNGQDYDWAVCAQADCYHGDSLGVLNVAEPSMYTEDQHPWYESKSLNLEAPVLSFQNGVLSVSFPEWIKPSDGMTYEFDSIEHAMDVRARMINPRLHSHYKEMIEMHWIVYEHSGHRIIASCVLEPIFMREGQMKFVDPLWQRALVGIAKSRGVPVIFDESVSGMYRFGVSSCREILQTDPDIGTYSDLLTGGLLPMSVTLASKETFSACTQDSALMHNDQFAAHPAGCVAAIQAIDAYNTFWKQKNNSPRRALTLFDQEKVKELSCLALVQESFSLGTVLVVAMRSSDEEGDEASGAVRSIVDRLRVEGVFAHTLGNVMYVMVSPLSSKEDCSRIADSLYWTIHAVGTKLA